MVAGSTIVLASLLVSQVPMYGGPQVGYGPQTSWSNIHIDQHVEERGYQIVQEAPPIPLKDKKHWKRKPVIYRGTGYRGDFPTGMPTKGWTEMPW